jgi:transketolase
MEPIQARSLSALKRPLSLEQDGDILRSLELDAITMRKKIIYMGYQNRISLHYGALFSMVEIVTVLYRYWMRYNFGNPDWEGRDRFVLSKGHGAPAVYAALWMAGFLPESHFNGFRRLGSILQGHPDRLKTPGIETSSGSLGQGFPVACGMALGAKIDQADFRVYALLGDGECNEGSIWEAALIASNLKIDMITALVDRNHKSSYGLMENRNEVNPLAEKWRAFNWAVYECDGHDFISLTNALYAAENTTGQPAVIICHTTKGKGVPYIEFENQKAHIFLSDEKHDECIAYLDEKERKVRHAFG